MLKSFFWISFNQIFMTPPECIRNYADTSQWSRGFLEHGQIKSEHLINLNAAGIILFQVLIA